MGLFLLDVVAGPIIIVGLIILLIIIGVIIGLIYLAVLLIRKIKRDEDEKFLNKEKDDL